MSYSSFLGNIKISHGQIRLKIVSPVKVKICFVSFGCVVYNIVESQTLLNGGKK